MTYVLPFLAFVSDQIQTGSADSPGSRAEPLLIYLCDVGTFAMTPGPSQAVQARGSHVSICHHLL